MPSRPLPEIVARLPGRPPMPEELRTPPLGFPADQ